MIRPRSEQAMNLPKFNKPTIRPSAPQNVAASQAPQENNNTPAANAPAAGNEPNNVDVNENSNTSTPVDDSSAAGGQRSGSASGRSAAFLYKLKTHLNNSGINELIEFLDENNIDFTQTMLSDGGCRIKFEHQGIEYNIRQYGDDGRYELKYEDEKGVKHTETYNPENIAWYEVGDKLMKLIEEIVGTGSPYMLSIINKIIDAIHQKPSLTEDDVKKLVQDTLQEIIDADKAPSKAPSDAPEVTTEVELDEYLGIDTTQYDAEEKDYLKEDLDLATIFIDMEQTIRTYIYGKINIDNTEFKKIWDDLFEKYIDPNFLEDKGLKDKNTLSLRNIVESFLNELSEQILAANYTPVVSEENTNNAPANNVDFTDYAVDTLEELSNSSNQYASKEDAEAAFKQVLQKLKDTAKNYAKTVLNMSDVDFEELWKTIQDKYISKMSIYIVTDGNDNLLPHPHNHTEVNDRFEEMESIENYILNITGLAKAVIASLQDAFKQGPNRAPAADDLPGYAKSEIEKLNTASNYSTAEKARKAYEQTIDGLRNIALAYARAKGLDDDRFESIWNEIKHSYTNIFGSKMYQFVAKRKGTSYWTLSAKALAEAFLKELGDRIDPVAAKLAKAKETPLTEYAKEYLNGLSEKKDCKDKKPKDYDVHELIYKLYNTCYEYAINVLGLDKKTFNKLFDSNFNNIQALKDKYISITEIQRGRSYVKQYVLNEKQLVYDFLENLHNALLDEIK